MYIIDFILLISLGCVERRHISTLTISQNILKLTLIDLTFDAILFDRNYSLRFCSYREFEFRYHYNLYDYDLYLHRYLIRMSSMETFGEHY